MSSSRRSRAAINRIAERSDATGENKRVSSTPRRQARAASPLMLMPGDDTGGCVQSFRASPCEPHEAALSRAILLRKADEASAPMMKPALAGDIADFLAYRGWWGNSRSRPCQYFSLRKATPF